ncbi:MAG TPA: phosphatidylcholine/phosphatidylserine synthase [Alphaproteobacteria bacterium]
MSSFFLTPSDDKSVENKRLLGIKLLPNILTIVALCTGLTALRFGIDGRWTGAMILVLCAAFLDGIDGTVARLLKATSDFGAQLDSFSDFVSFGVAPATLLYLWNLHEAGAVGWVAALLLCVATALRLARFNVKNSVANWPEELPQKKMFFEGVPSPAGAILALLPMILSFQMDTVENGGFPSFLVGLWVLLVAGLMVSRVPTYSMKRIKLSQKYMIPVLALVALFVAALASEPWLTLSFVSVVYMGSIFRSMRKYKGLFAAQNAGAHTVSITPVSPTAPNEQTKA